MLKKIYKLLALIALAESIAIACCATCALDYVTAFVVLGVAVWLWCSRNRMRRDNGKEKV